MVYSRAQEAECQLYINISNLPERKLISILI